MTSYMGEPFDTFQAALTSCGSTAVFYLWEAGEVTPIRWDQGLNAASEERDPRQPLIANTWLAPNQLAIQVAIAAGYVN